MGKTEFETHDNIELEPEPNDQTLAPLNASLANNLVLTPEFGDIQPVVLLGKLSHQTEQTADDEDNVNPFHKNHLKLIKEGRNFLKRYTDLVDLHFLTVIGQPSLGKSSLLCKLFG
jgi:putative ribosome biogenesis GTPase RsgA